MAASENPPTPVRMPQAQKDLSQLGAFVESEHRAAKLWQASTPEERSYLGGDFLQAYRNYGTVRMWRQLRGGSWSRAVIEVAWKLRHLSGDQARGLLEEVGEEPKLPQIESQPMGEPAAVAAESGDINIPVSPPLTPDERTELLEVKNKIDPNGEYIGTSDAILRVFGDIERFNREPNMPVLLTGETGVGKSAIAEWIHKSSERGDDSFERVSAADSPAGDPMIWRGKWTGYGPNSGLPNMDPKGQEGTCKDTRTEPCF